MFEDRLERVKKEIRSVIITFPNGVSLTGFLKTYKQLLGMHLPTREFGYISDIDFLFSLPDVVSIGTNRSGDYELKCVADENTKHIQQLVSKQKIAKHKNSHFSNKNLTTVRNNTFEVKPFVSATLRENLFKILSEYPNGISYTPLLLAYQKMFKKQLNLNWLSDNHHDRLKKLASAVSELEVRDIDNTEKLFYFPNKIGKKENLEEPKTFLNYTPFKATTLTRNRRNDIQDKTSCVCAISQTLKDDFEKVMKQFPNGILAKHFPALYEKLTGKVFKLSDLGFNSFLELADTLNEIFICERYESCNDWKLFHPIFKKSGSQFKDFNTVLELSSKKLKDINIICKQDVFCDISSPTISYAKPQFPNDISLTEYIPVFISAVISPSHFWFKLQCESVVSRFRDLEEKMQYFYHSDLSARLKMKSKDISVGATCAAEHEDCWYRVMVVTSVQYEFVMVYLVDYGSCEKIKISSLRYLKSEFITLPAQAFKAELASVKPFKNSRSWSERAENRFLELCDVSCLMAQIHTKFDDKLSVFLCDTSGEDDIHVNDVLVEEGLAESSTESLSLEMDSDLASGMNKTCNDAINSEVLTKKVFLGDGYKIHIIVAAKEAYVCAGELCSLFWPNKPSEMLKSRLELKSIVVPSIKISKEDHKQLFYQCESFGIQDFHHVSLSKYSVELYPLSFVMKVLNALGHPSIKVRKTIKKELQNFDPFNISWRTSNDKDMDSSGPKLEGINNLCMYDLKVLHETIKCKKIKLKSDLEKRRSDNVVEELEQVKKFESTIKNRIDYIQSVCSSYSSGDN